MALSPAAERLKNLKKGKKSDKSDEDEKDEKGEAQASPKSPPKKEDGPDEGGGSLSEMLDEKLGEGGEEEEEIEVSETVEMGGEAGAPAGGDSDPIRVFSDVLELDDLTAQAVYGEAMALPELSEMEPEAMAKKIKGNYDMLKKIIMSMGEKAAVAMQDDMNQPMAPPAGPDMGGPPMGGPPPGGMGPMA
jgi:hypothetical protein